MTITPSAKTVTNLLENVPLKLAVPLAKPWHYRRNGRYYLRLRTRERPYSTFSVSLRTTDRATAMEVSQKIQRALAYFHLDRPEATREELRARLIAIAEECLATACGTPADFTQSEAYREMHSALQQVSAGGNLPWPQHKALIEGQRILAAANARIDGRSEGLIQIIERLNSEAEADRKISSTLPLSVGAPQEPLSWTKLSELYMAEQINLKESSRKAALTAHTVIGNAFEAIGVTDLRTHTRENLIGLREKLLESRKASTVNNLLAKLIAVLNWAVANDKITKTYTTKLKITKGADSDREAFTRAQVVAIMDHAKSLPATAWERWALSLLAITGARVGEISYLTSADIKEVDGLWCIDINEDISEGGDENSPEKSIKNKHSARKVPLVDGALGFDLREFLQAVEVGALPSANGINPTRASQRLNVLLKEVLGTTKKKNQTLHSLRHHLVSSMQAEGVELQFMQAVAGHASRTITLDAYGSSVPLRKLAEAISKALAGGAA